jgi:hypothetical protein
MVDLEGKKGKKKREKKKNGKEIDCFVTRHSDGGLKYFPCFGLRRTSRT